MKSRTYILDGVCCSEMIHFHLSIVDEDGDINIRQIIKDGTYMVIKFEYTTQDEQLSNNEWYEEPNASLNIYVKKFHSEQFKNYIELIGFRPI